MDATLDQIKTVLNLPSTVKTITCAICGKPMDDSQPLIASLGGAHYSCVIWCAEQYINARSWRGDYGEQP